MDPAARDVAPTEVRFSRELGLARAVSRSLAILLAALVFTLQGSVLVSAGPAAAVSYLMMGVVCSLTLLCYVELLVRGGREGGAYVLLREATRGPVAFLTGWAILLGGLLLSAVLALGFAASASTFVEALLGVRLGEPGMAALLIVVIAVYNVLGGWSHRRVRGIVTWLVAALLLLLCLVCLPPVRLTDYGPFSPHGYLGVQAGLSLLFIGFLAFESLPLTMSEIPEPRRTIPRAFLATAGLGILLSMAVTLVAGSSLTGVGLLEVRLPVAALAEECAGGYGPLVLLLAVIFIPMALNSALLLVVRQAQEMEQDGLLPDFLRRRTVRFQTPHILLALIGALAALLSLWGDLEQIARLGGFCILFAMSMIALGNAMRMRGAEEEPSGFRLPVPPLIPALALVVNVFLLPMVGTGPLLAGAVWLGAGLVVYVVHARGRYIAGQEGVVVFRAQREPLESKYRVLVPLGPGARGSRS